MRTADVPSIYPGDGILEPMRARVLVVDDDPALAEMLGIVLRSEGFAPAFVADGERALAAFREVRPDIVLLDLMLPGMSGIELLSKIRHEYDAPPPVVMMITAYDDEEIAEIIRLTGARPSRPTTSR